MMSDQAGEVTILIPVIEQLSSITEQSGSSQTASKPLIQKVPHILIDMKKHFKEYFEPRVVALGPLHHGDPKLEQGEQSKREFAALFVRKNETTEHALLDKIKAEIEDLKEFYKPEDIKDYDNEKLAWMFFVDGCAVLYAVCYGLRSEFANMDFTKANLIPQVDLFLLGNQLPYRLLNILIYSTKNPPMWEELITKFIRKNLITKKSPGQQRPDTEDQKDGRDYAHLLERLRKRQLTRVAEETKISNNSLIGKMLLCCGKQQTQKKKFRSIKELKESGISVKPSQTNSNISFYCNVLGTIMMPSIMVDDSTGSKFMNLVALEMCPDFENCFEITTYLCFLNSLIDTAEDVKELRVTGMLHNNFGRDEDVADLISEMRRGLVPNPWIYVSVIKDIHNYCNNPWTTTVAQAYYTHFSSPWTFVAFLGSIIGLLFTAIQAYFALLRYEKGLQTP